MAGTRCSVDWQSRSLRRPPDGAYVAGAVENAGELGMSMIFNRWEASLRVRHLGDYPPTENNSLRAYAETSLNLRGA